MKYMILKTKLFLPQLKHGLVHRSRLISLLKEGFLNETGFTRKLTLVSAPAGYGKTTLIRQWAQDFLPRVAWLTLDASDNQPLFFLRYLIAAIKTVDSDSCKGTWDFINSNSMMLGGLKEIAREDVITFINDLIAIQDPLILVLEDFHTIDNEGIQDVLTTVIENLPPLIHIVVTTRTDPPWPLHRWRVQRELEEIRQKDLAMVKEEAQHFLNDLMGCAIEDQDIEMLMDKTEGWPGSLQMAALSIKSSQDIPGFIRNFTGSSRYILDYFTDEVLRGQREELKEFLLKTSILTSLSGDLCNHIMDGDNSQELLEEMEKANLFIIPTDTSRKRYRYHPLFGQLLRVHLRKLYPESIECLHVKAAHWYANHNMPREALEHAFAVSDQSLAIRLLEENIEELWFGSGSLQAKHWLEKLDEHSIDQNLKLKLFTCIFKLLEGAISEAEKALHEVTKSMEEVKRGEADNTMDRAKRAEIIGLTGMVAAYIAKFKGNAHDVVKHSQIALENLTKKKSLFRPGIAIVSGDASLLMGNFTKATDAYNEAIVEGKSTGHHFFVQLAYACKAFINWFIGNLHSTEAICKTHKEFARANEMESTPRAGVIWALWGDILREKNQLDVALAYAQKACQLSRREALVLIWSKLIHAKVHVSMNGIEEAHETLLEIEEMLKGASSVVGFEQTFQSLKVKVLLKRDPAIATAYIKDREIFSHEEILPFNLSIYIAMARVLMAEGKIQQASELLSRIYPVANKKQIIAWMIEIQSLQALALYSMAHTDSSLQAIKEALSLAQKEGYMRIFLDEGQSILPIIQEAHSRGICVDYTQKILAHVSGREIEDTRRNSVVQLIEPLSDREIEIITLISQGRSNQEIAALLYVSLNTVKWHASNIYGKLSVQNRTEAVAKARELKIIE